MNVQCCVRVSASNFQVLTRNSGGTRAFGNIVRFLAGTARSLFCDHGLDSRKMSECENIVIISSTLTPHAQMQGGKPAGHYSSALASAEEDGFDNSAAHPCTSLVVMNTILLTFVTPIRSRQAVSPM